MALAAPPPTVVRAACRQVQGDLGWGVGGQVSGHRAPWVAHEGRCPASTPEHGGYAHADIEGQAERASGQEDDGPGQEHQSQLLFPAQRLPRRPQRIKKPRQPQLSNAKSFQGLAAVAVNVSRNINQARCAVQQVVLISKIWVVLKDNYWRPLRTLS